MADREQQIILSSDLAPPEPACQYRFSGLRIVSNLATARLSGFETDAPVPGGWPSAREISGGVTTYRGTGFIAHRDRRIECRYAEPGYRVHIEGLGRFQIDPEQGAILHRTSGRSTSDPEQVWLACLGPCLPLLLVASDRFVLHASAVAGERLSAFAGETAQGKSTLSAFLAKAAGRRLVADDMLPVEACSGSIEVATPWPQLKVPGHCRDARREPRLDRFVVLRPDEGLDRPVIRRLGQPEAAVALGANTVASRLFDRRHVESHLAFSRRFVQRVECLELRFRRERDQLAGMRDALAPL